MDANKKKELIRPIKYCCIAASAGVIQFGSFTVFNELTNWPYWPSYLISLVLSVLWNFTINRKFTFKGTNNVAVAMLKEFGYYLVFTPISTLGGNWLVESAGWNEYLVEIINMLLNTVTEYLFQRFVVYGKNVDTAVSKKDKEAAEAAAAAAAIENAADKTADTIEEKAED